MAASCIAAPVQRSAIGASRQYFTLRHTRRMLPIMFSMMLVQAKRLTRNAKATLLRASPIGQAAGCVIRRARILSCLQRQREHRDGLDQDHAWPVSA